MKKIFSAVLAGAMVASLSVSAFAVAITDPVVADAYDNDGAKNDDVSSISWNAVPSDDATAAAIPSSLTLDGVVPDATVYVPLVGGMKAVAEIGSSKAVVADVLTDDDYFKFDVDKDDGSKYVKDIDLVTDKRLGSLTRSAYLKIELNDSLTTSELKSTGTISFKAKADADSYTGSKDIDDKNTYEAGNEIKINYTFWINNKSVKGEDGEASTGDRVYFDPADNEENTLIWGDDRAALFFEGNDDAGKFYARLQTKADSEIYANYADPVNADLWFYDFVGNPTVPSTSRATLTLGIPWDEDDDYTPNPEDCFIYEKDADGILTDVTDRFTYSEENDGSTEIEGWTIKTRTLGTYVISDVELDTAVVEEVEEVEETEEAEETEEVSPSTDGKAIPNTGSSDMVGAAVVAAVASLAAAGAVAFKKASK